MSKKDSTLPTLSKTPSVGTFGRGRTQDPVTTTRTNPRSRSPALSTTMSSTTTSRTTTRSRSPQTAGGWTTAATEQKPALTSDQWINGRVTRVVIVGAGASSSTPKLECCLKGANMDCKACKDAVNNPLSPNHRLNPCLLIQTEAQDPDVIAAVMKAKFKFENSKDKEESHANQVLKNAHEKGGEKHSSKKDCRFCIQEAGEKKLAARPLKGNILIDVCKTFRESTIKVLVPAGVTSLNSVILTHDHADATLGLDDIREFSSNHDASKGKEVVPCCAWTDDRTNKSMQRVFPYLFPQPGQFKSYVAQIDWTTFEHFEPFNACGVPIIPFPVEHGPNYISNGYAIPTPEGTILYISDVSMIPQETFDLIANRLQPLKLLVLDMLASKHTPVHFNYDEAVEAAKKIAAPQTYFVGMGHLLEYHKFSEKLLSGPFPKREAIFARDGLVIYDSVNPETVGTTVMEPPGKKNESGRGERREKKGGETYVPSAADPKACPHAERVQCVAKVVAVGAATISVRNGKVGSLKCQLASGKPFNLVTGVDVDNPPVVGAFIIISCAELSETGVPRFPKLEGTLPTAPPGGGDEWPVVNDEWR